LPPFSIPTLTSLFDFTVGVVPLTLPIFYVIFVEEVSHIEEVILSFIVFLLFGKGGFRILKEDLVER